jgi:hypothetical protein
LPQDALASGQLRWWVTCVMSAAVDALCRISTVLHLAQVSVQRSVKTEPVGPLATTHPPGFFKRDGRGTPPPGAAHTHIEREAAVYGIPPVCRC